MRSFINVIRLGLLPILLLSAGWAHAGGRLPDCYLLAVGVDDHLNAEKLRGPANLRGPAGDARNLTKAFQAQEGHRFGKVHAYTLIDKEATRANIRDKMNIISQQGKVHDFVVLSFAGHGGRGNNQWLFSPYDYDPKNIAATALSDQAILEAADELVSQGKKVVVIIDSCQAGQVGKTAQEYLKRYGGPAGGGGGLIVMLSCGPDELVFSLGTYSPFSKALAESIAGKGDVDKDGRISLSAIKKYTKKRTNELVVGGGQAKKQDSQILWSKSIADTLPLAVVVPDTVKMAEPKQPAVTPWTGKTVVIKNPGVSIDVIEDGARVSVGTLDDFQYRVIKEDRGLIKVTTSAGVAGWFEKVEAVPLDEAVAFFTDRIAKNPNDARAYLVRASIAKMEGRLELALKDYKELLRLDPRAAAYNNRAVVLHALKQYDLAIADFNEANKLDPGLIAPVYGRGLALLGKNDFDEAIKDFTSVLEMAPLRQLAAKKAQGWKEYVNKEGGFSVRFPRTPSEVAVSGAKGVELKIPGSEFVASYLDSTSEAIAQAVIDQLMKYPAAKKTKIMLGNYYGEERMIELPDGKNQKLRAYLVGKRLYLVSYTWSPLRGGTLAEADLFLTSFKLWSPKDEVVVSRAGPGYAAAAHNGRGDAYRGKKEYDKAIEEYTAALKLEKDLPFVLNNRGLVFFLTAEYESAIKDFATSEKLDAENGWVYKNRAKLLATAANGKYRDGKKAITLAKKALELERYPNADFYETLAAAYAEAGQFADAVRTQEQVIDELDLRDDSEALRRLALYRKKQPERQEGFNEAELLIHAVERKIYDAKTVAMTVSFVMKAEKEETNLKGAALFAKGGKARLELAGDKDGEKLKLTVVSDGVQLKSKRTKANDKAEFYTKETPTDAGALMTAGAGLYGFLFLQEVDTLSGIAMGPKEKVGDREAQRIDYRIRFRSIFPQDTFAVQVWLDSETNLPVRRIITHEVIDVRISETYDIRLNGTIDAKEFELPK